MKRIIAGLLLSAFLMTTETFGQEQEKQEVEKEKSEKREGEKRRARQNNANELRQQPRFKNRIPRQLTHVPKGHYPPPGECRIWYPGQPAGQQPPPVPCNSLIGARLEPGAFILHNDKAYDAEYNWKEDPNQERQKEDTRTIPRQIIDILFPNLEQY